MALSAASRMISLRPASMVLIALVSVLTGCGQTPPSATPNAAVLSPPLSTAASPSAAVVGPSAGVPSEGPSPTAVPTDRPTPKPTATAVPTKLKTTSFATVVTDGLRVRSAPGVGVDSDKRSPLLQRGQLVVVVGGPKSASGYAWYLVQPIDRGVGYADDPFGWVAASDHGGEPWLKAGGRTCPSTPKSFATLADIAPLVALVCLRDRDITFPARLYEPEATCGIDLGWTIEPDWLGSTCPHPDMVIADPTTAESRPDWVFAPGVDRSDLHPGVDETAWLPVVITGHYDDPAARSCRIVVHDTDTAADIGSDQAILRCRSTFVVTGIVQRGID